jgi:hypothetical protein
MLYLSAENNSLAFGCENERFCFERKAVLEKVVFVLRQRSFVEPWSRNAPHSG